MKFFCVMLALSIAACSPCKKLAKQICDCEKNESARNNCKKNLDLRSQHKAFSKAEDRERCQAILDSGSCTCDALQAEQYESCGLTRP